MQEVSDGAYRRIAALITLRDIVYDLLFVQMHSLDAALIQAKQVLLSQRYDAFVRTYGLINSRANKLAFAEDSSYYLLCSLEILDEDGNMERKADIFTKRTIAPHQPVTQVETASEALTVSMNEKGRVDLHFMASLLGKEPNEEGDKAITDELQGTLFLTRRRKAGRRRMSICQAMSVPSFAWSSSWPKLTRITPPMWKPYNRYNRKSSRPRKLTSG